MPNNRTSNRREPGTVARPYWFWPAALAATLALAWLLRAQGTAPAPLRPPTVASARIDLGALEPHGSPPVSAPPPHEQPHDASTPANASSDAGVTPLVQRTLAAHAAVQVERTPGPAVLMPASAPSASASASAPASASTRGYEARRVARAALAAWLQPGLCGGSAEAALVRERVSSSFRLADFAEKGRFYLDPRLPPDSELPLLESLNRAENEVGARLGLHPARPLVFVYADQPLLKASACINEDVVAFYDGALHVVVNRADLFVSMLHEYAHHAMFSAGLMGPTWAQEGIAMHVAKENWWREAPRLRTLLDAPFALEEMERAIPYKLKPEQAVAFYVQSAALVACVMRERRWSLQQVFETLRARVSSEAVTYDLPELERRAFLRDCLGQGLPPG